MADLGGLETSLDDAHEAIQGITNNANREDAQNDVSEAVGVVLLPEKAADSRHASEHFHGS